MPKPAGSVPRWLASGTCRHRLPNAAPGQIVPISIRIQRGTGRLAGPFCYGPGKVDAIHELARWEGLDLAQCYAYSDSASDLPMLEAVGHPVAVNPDSRLERLALRRGWPIVIFSRRTKAVVRRTSQGVGATSLAIGSFVAGMKYAAQRGSRAS